ncbi:hypothetical protein [Massilia glaciei]|uniref:Uncharacterized protein n=1 Tax=Massilia glaciei TaxID=1524097 RepID=A0A2U2HEF8_9BURK|nr:hypothetical protein [Massilia glaciei]PWF41908.1 hypothetical protein C7C56_023655 [Massilia glaciei]
MQHNLTKPNDKEAALAERKAKLLRQGELYRVGIVHSRAHLRNESRPEAIMHAAFEHATHAVRSRLDGLLAPTGMSVAAIMPYAATIMGFISRRRLIKPAIGLVAVAAGLAWYLQRRRARAAYTY